MAHTLSGRADSATQARVLKLLRDHGPLSRVELADRLGISRTAVSHLEAGLSEPGERTVALLAGVFKVEPHELVAGTRYPRGKAERLPVVVARYTEVELQLELLDVDLRWLEQVPDAEATVLDEWEVRLRALFDTTHDERERTALADALTRLRTLRP